MKLQFEIESLRVYWWFTAGYAPGWSAAWQCISKLAALQRVCVRSYNIWLPWLWHLKLMMLLVTTYVKLFDITWGGHIWIFNILYGLTWVHMGKCFVENLLIIVEVDHLHKMSSMPFSANFCNSPNHFLLAIELSTCGLCYTERNSSLVKLAFLKSIIINVSFTI